MVIWASEPEGGRGLVACYIDTLVHLTDFTGRIRLAELFELVIHSFCQPSLMLFKMTLKLLPSSSLRVKSCWEQEDQSGIRHISNGGSGRDPRTLGTGDRQNDLLRRGIEDRRSTSQPWMRGCFNKHRGPTNQGREQRSDIYISVHIKPGISDAGHPKTCASATNDVDQNDRNWHWKKLSCDSAIGRLESSELAPLGGTAGRHARKIQ
ncbi:uncharacterized protein BCR38DRAFT_510389 [Pseudomassariella vexata]|uniref:Uncharacterized protein n=1 Tax=Pseudomassariella vexata TaxID=1141098 RepID=A0A1Y2E7B2_9PEZI|nr:uncharacterized protein BCR38DRAFT_510389 [Pseudomassariella vexata]ORY67463.1 hypothetical protein BCR38DRAFT_510389 [Pseudomassariella vexata]